MTTGLLDFFILEGSEHVEQLDALIVRAQGGAPDAGAFATHARALRGSATMAKVMGIANVASGLERIARALRDRRFAWSTGTNAAVVAAIDDLKILLHGVRTWGQAEDQRAAARTAELEALAPTQDSRAATAATAGGHAFLATQTSDVADALALLAQSGARGAAATAAVDRVRALRGVAALNDLPPLAEVVAAADDVVKSLELSAATPGDLQRDLLEAAASVLREGAQALRAAQRPDPNSAAVMALSAAAQALTAGAADADRVVPIASLFANDAGPHIVHAAANPPTTPGERFRIEVVSHAEHLRRLIGDARHAADAAAIRRLGHELRIAVRALARAAESFDEQTVAMTLQALIEGASLLDARALAALERATALLTAPGEEPLAPRFAALLGPQATPDATPDATRAATPDATPAAPVAAERDAPSGAALASLLGAGIAGLARLDDEPLSQPVPIDEDDGVVPIQDLLYRGKAALRRAIEIGDTAKRLGTTPTADTLAELFDLLELAAAD